LRKKRLRVIKKRQVPGMASEVPECRGNREKNQQANHLPPKIRYLFPDICCLLFSQDYLLYNPDFILVKAIRLRYGYQTRGEYRPKEKLLRIKVMIIEGGKPRIPGLFSRFLNIEVPLNIEAQLNKEAWIVIAYLVYKIVYKNPSQHS
jgi:hypothetical protein